MPHIGRSYPYHPIYWSTEAWFYPGHCPWKLKAEQIGSLPPFFGCVFGSPAAVSAPGEASELAKNVKYVFVVLYDCLVTGITVWMESPPGFPHAVPTWRCRFEYWDGSFQVLTKVQPYPQRVVHSPSFELSIPNPDVGPNIQMFCEFTPASYAEGGSPYPYPNTGLPPP
jgi:hypothetical protein